MASATGRLQGGQSAADSLPQAESCCADGRDSSAVSHQGQHCKGTSSLGRPAALALSSPDVPAVQVAETAVQFFISADKVNVAGLVLAGSADFKTELSQSDMFDQRLQAAILAVVDVSYGEP